MTRTAFNTAALVTLTLTCSTSALAEDSIEVEFQNSLVSLQTLPMGDGTCTLEVEAEVRQTSNEDDLESTFVMDAIQITGGDKFIEFIPGMWNFMQEDAPCDEDDYSVVCKAYTMMIADAFPWQDDDGEWQDGWWQYEYDYLTSVSIPAGENTYSLRQYTLEAEGGFAVTDGEVFQERERVALNCDCWYRWDLNNDGQVSTADALVFLTVYGQNVDGTANAAMDINGDGLVGTLELMDLLSQFGGTCAN